MVALVVARAEVAVQQVVGNKPSLRYTPIFQP